MRRPRPGPRQITEADEAMLWLPLARHGNRLDPLGAGQLQGLEGDLLGALDWSGDSQPTPRIWTGRDRVASQRQSRTAQAVDGLCGGQGPSLTGLFKVRLQTLNDGPWQFKD